MINKVIMVYFKVLYDQYFLNYNKSHTGGNYYFTIKKIWQL